MRVEVIPATQLTQELMAEWRRIQRSDPALASPFFCPEFTVASAEFYPNTQVGVIEESDRVVGFLPFQRQWGRAGLTCIWQVRGRSRVSFEEWMRMDAAYIRSLGFRRDLLILLQTIPAVLLRRGAC